MSDSNVISLYSSEDGRDSSNDTWPFNVPWMFTDIE
jgi:hypothetical protein